jgi:hypothetical protein
VSIVGDAENFFELNVGDHDANGVLSAALVKSDGPTLDREIEVGPRLHA